MKRGERAGKTRQREDLAEHFAIKPKRGEPVPSDAHRRLQLAPSDPRWEMSPPYGWVKMNPGESLPNGLISDKCWYCALRVELSMIGDTFLYSKRLSMVAHVECFAHGDTNPQKRVTLDST